MTDPGWNALKRHWKRVFSPYVDEWPECCIVIRFRGDMGVQRIWIRAFKHGGVHPRFLHCKAGVSDKPGRTKYFQLMRDAWVRVYFLRKKYGVIEEIRTESEMARGTNRVLFSV